MVTTQLQFIIIIIIIIILKLYIPDDPACPKHVVLTEIVNKIIIVASTQLFIFIISMMHGHTNIKAKSHNTGSVTLRMTCGKTNNYTVCNRFLLSLGGRGFTVDKVLC